MGLFFHRRARRLGSPCKHTLSARAWGRDRDHGTPCLFLCSLWGGVPHLRILCLYLGHMGRVGTWGAPALGLAKPLFRAGQASKARRIW